MKNKKCSMCEEIQPAVNFSPNGISPSGIQIWRSNCKRCGREATKKRGLLPRVKKQREAYGKSEKYKEVKRRYNSSEKGREKNKAAARQRFAKMSEEQLEKKREYQRKWRKTEVGRTCKKRDFEKIKEQKKHLVYRKLHTELRAGRIVRKVCEKCGGDKTQAHHDDYSKPLDVRWLCPKHHAEHHRNDERK